MPYYYSSNLILTPMEESSQSSINGMAMVKMELPAVTTPLTTPIRRLK